MNHLEFLKSKYKNKINPIEYSVDDVIRNLKERLDLRQVSTGLLLNTFFEASKKNAYHSIANQEKNLNIEALEFIVFEVTNNVKSQDYYSVEEDIVDVLNNDMTDNKIIILIEERLNFSTSNSEKLKLELNICRGISKYDYDNETDLFSAYLSYLDLFEEQSS